jgi:hypothetical protein
MKLIFELIVASLLLTAKPALAQNACSSLQAPDNPYFSNVEWPTYHHDNYRQASTCYAGPRDGDKIKMKMLKNLKGGTSCWTHLTEPYKNGKRVILQSNA